MPASGGLHGVADLEVIGPPLAVGAAGDQVCQVGLPVGEVAGDLAARGSRPARASVSLLAWAREILRARSRAWASRRWIRRSVVAPLRW